MGLTVAVVAQGAMGAGIGRRLSARGATVLTVLDGRGPASARRAAEAGMRPVSMAEAAGADVFLSVVPPGAALDLARAWAPVFAAAPRRPIFVDCNAVSPPVAEAVAEVVSAAGCEALDGGIIGQPPGEDDPGPVLCLSGPDTARLRPLEDHGLRLRHVGERIGQASALKMSFAGITKGVQGLCAMMVLAAGREGLADALKAEIAAVEPGLDAFMTRFPRMFDKAWRWVDEMDEIGAFLEASGEPGGRKAFEAVGELYGRVAEDRRADGPLTAALAYFAGQRP